MRNRRRTDVQALAGLGVLLLSLGFGNMVVTAGADTVGAPVTVTATVTRTGQTNVSAPGPLTGLADGDEVVLTAMGNPAPFFGFDARICKPISEVEVVQQSDFSPTSGGNCLGAPFAGGAADDQFKTISAAPGNTTASVAFRVGAGSQPDAAPDLDTTITCGVGNPCALWLKLSVPSTFNAGTAWTRFDLVYGSDVAVTTTSTTTTSTTTVAAPTTTRVTTTTIAGTSTTVVGGTSTTVAGATTTTTTGPITVTPSSLAAGDTLNVTTVGWKPDSTITATLNSDPVTLGTLTADATGKATKAFTVPAGFATGAHTVKLAGTGSDNAARELTAAVTVVAPTTTTAPGSPLARTGASGVWHLLWNSTALIFAGSLLMVTAIRRGRDHA